MQVEIIMPWRGGCEWRHRSMLWTTAQWKSEFPKWNFTIAERSGDSPWVKALAVMPMVDYSTSDIIIVADADVWCSSGAIREAVDNVATGSPWAIPHGKVHRLSRDATEAFLAGQSSHAERLDEPPYWGIAGGGLVVVKRDVAIDVPMDQRFHGWGGEDHSWGYALRTIYGKPFRGDAALIHFWHPKPVRVSRKVGSHQSEALRKRYRDARQNAETMRELVKEAKDDY